MSQCLSNLCGIEAAVFEEAHLPGTLLRISGLASKFLAAYLARKFVPIDLGRFQCAKRQGLFNTTLLEFLLYTARSVAAPGATANEAVGIAAILLQAFIGQVVERGGNIVVLESLGAEFPFQLTATMFAAGQRADRKVAR